jgi:uncharacterized membrane protein HdeD (DUF308 family)
MQENVARNNSEGLRHKWGWLVVLGIILMLLGVFTLGHAVLATLVSTLLIGWLLVIGGVVEAVHSFQVRGWGGFLLGLLLAVLYVVAGIIILGAPAGSALALTLVIAAYLLVGGIFRVVAALTLRFPGSGWLAFSGIVAAVLGIAVWRNWPATGLWFLGLCVGVELLVQGASWFALGLTVHSVDRGIAPQANPGTPPALDA